jgi:protein-L-isoaspartate(D-aspartate) O-methyltransferase
VERDVSLRETLVAQLERTGILRRPEIAAAMRRVPRHRFLSGVTLDEAYADRAIAIKMQGEEIVSSISQPGMIAQMLELLAARPGDRVLEIGTGSAYNAALLSDIVGPRGCVTTIDLDADLARRAGATLEALGYDNVRVRAADGAFPAHSATPYDRLIVTARADDVASAWWDAVREEARLVVPLRLVHAGEYAVGFVLRGRLLRSVGLHPCAFIAMRGEIAEPVASELFYRDPSGPNQQACLRRVASIVAVRREDATPTLLDEADLVIARPVSLFAVSFLSL